MSETLLLVAGGVGILLAGVGIGYWLSSSRVQIRIAEADEIRDKFDAYRRDVTEHFGRTAEHFQAIGEQYRELYEHLASGADSFCDVDTLDEKLVYEPTAAIGATPARPEEAPSERPRDYAEGEYADDEPEVEAAGGEAAETEEATVADKADAEEAEEADTARSKVAAQDAPADEAAEQPVTTDGNGRETGDEERQAAGADDDTVAQAVDDLKPEVKSDAEEKSSQPTLH